MDDILGLSRAKPDGSAARIKDMMRERLGIGEETTLMVSELHCHEDGCPDVETVIAVMNADRDKMTWKIAKPMTEVGEGDIQSLMIPQAAGA
ncbi:MAG: hypothetical protein CMM61_06560 [Rhodospirillaceae bacterium]|nr:hypothetical protein [Rhodospirillaceae bacterium]|tara:strand:- start:488 stop:763 length:276 start_codon:yes stop_codon:yes gene_type:complete